MRRTDQIAMFTWRKWNVRCFTEDRILKHQVNIRWQKKKKRRKKKYLIRYLSNLEMLKEIWSSRDRVRCHYMGKSYNSWDTVAWKKISASTSEKTSHTKTTVWNERYRGVWMEKLNKGFDFSQVEKTLHREKVACHITRRKFSGVHVWFMAISYLKTRVAPELLTS